MFYTKSISGLKKIFSLVTSSMLIASPILGFAPKNRYEKINTAFIQKLKNLDGFQAKITAYTNIDTAMEGGKYISIKNQQSQMLVENGVVAVDPVHWPYGTVFYIGGLGVVVAADCGKWIAGKNRLDIAIVRPNGTAAQKKHDIKYWGVQDLKVYVLYKPPIPKHGKNNPTVRLMQNFGNMKNYLEYIAGKKILPSFSGLMLVNYGVLSRAIKEGVYFPEGSTINLRGWDIAKKRVHKKILETDMYWNRREDVFVLLQQHLDDLKKENDLYKSLLIELLMIYEQGECAYRCGDYIQAIEKFKLAMRFFGDELADFTGSAEYIVKLKYNISLIYYELSFSDSERTDEFLLKAKSYLGNARELQTNDNIESLWCLLIKKMNQNS